MKHKHSITIGIPACNEERNIKTLLDALTSQNAKNYVVKKIIVLSDASTDSTDEIVTNYKNKYVQLVRNKTNKGKTWGIKKLLRLAAKNGSEFLFLIDADLKITKKEIITELISVIEKDSNIISVSGFAIPEKPKKIIEKIAHFGFYLWEKIIENKKEDAIFFRSSDPIILLRIDCFPTNKIANITFMHDEFYYLYAKKYNKKISFTKKATVTFLLPKSFSDYSKQMSRYISTHFTDDNIVKESNIISVSFTEKIKALLSECKKSPFIATSYLFIQTTIHIQSKIRKNNFVNTWDRIESTK